MNTRIGIDICLERPPRAIAPPALFARVALAIDFCSASLSAARWATAHVAREAHAILVHVVPLADGDAQTAGDLGSPADVLREMRPMLLGGLSGFGATLDVASARAVVRAGRASEWLADVVAGADSTLLVLGRRSESARERIGEPCLTERVARRTPTAVLVVPQSCTAPPTHLIAAVDEDPASAAPVLALARGLAARYAWPLTVLHVVTPALGRYDKQLRASRTRARVAGSRTGIAPAAPPESRGLERLLHAMAGTGGTSPVIAVGDPACKIAAAAREQGSAIVIVGKRGADDAPRGSLGSVARDLIARSPAPLLLVETGQPSGRLGLASAS